MDAARTVGEPREWVASGGRWAPLLDEWDGLPSYESDDGSLVVHELAVVQDAVGLEEAFLRRGGRVVVTPRRETIIPRGYGLVAARNMALDETSGLVPLHDAPGARWMWRPLLYDVLPDGTLRRFGSQVELAWRNGLLEAQRRTLARRDLIARAATRLAVRPEPLPAEDEWVAAMREMIASWERQTPWAFVEADARAREILLEHLTWQQRLDFEATHRFYVRGHAHEMYLIQPGNGVSVVDAATREVRASLCLHPETWMPHDDVALAHKLLIESGPDGERALLDAARRYPVGWAASPATRADRYARDAERWLEGAEA